MSAILQRSGQGRSRVRAVQAGLAALLALASVPLMQSPASASTGMRTVIGAGCHNDTWVGWLWPSIYQWTDCLSFDAASTADRYGVAVLESVSSRLEYEPPSVTAITLDCMVVEDRSWGHRVFASGADASGARHSVTVSTAPTRSGFVAGTAAGPAPCGAWDYEHGVDAGGFQVSPPSSGSNALPTATFAHDCDGLTCTFDATGSRDPDGTVSSYRWSFGDNSFGVGANVTHTYSAEDDGYPVQLTVVDDDGGADETVRSVAAGVSSAYPLSAELVQQGKRVKVILGWAGALTSTVHISRNSAHLATVPDTGSYSDLPNGGTYVYQVCDEARTRCSNTATVTF